jgi:hypothetical protein
MRQMRRVDQNARLRMAQAAADAKAAGVGAGTDGAASDGRTSDGEEIAGDRADVVVGEDSEDGGRSAATDQG